MDEIAAIYPPNIPKQSDTIINMGNINMKALEIYEDLVKEHQNLLDKTNNFSK